VLNVCHYHFNRVQFGNHIACVCEAFATLLFSKNDRVPLWQRVGMRMRYVCQLIHCLAKQSQTCAKCLPSCGKAFATMWQLHFSQEHIPHIFRKGFANTLFGRGKLTRTLIITYNIITELFNTIQNNTILYFSKYQEYSFSAQ